MHFTTISSDNLWIACSTIFWLYSSLVRGTCNQTCKNRLQKLHNNRTARVITGDTYNITIHAWNIVKAKMENVRWKKEEKTISLVKKVLNHMCPPKITSMFQIANNENYNLRSNNKMLMLPKPKTNAMIRSFSYAARVWNNRIQNRSYSFQQFVNIFPTLCWGWFLTLDNLIYFNIMTS